MFRVVIHKNVGKELRNLKKAHLKKFAELIEILKNEPVPWKHFDIRKVKGEENTYRARIGDFRVIYYIDKISKTIHILKVERRERVY